jgi:5,10-methylenetetrahydromethanopterin reductase
VTVRLGLGLLQEYPPDRLASIVRLTEEAGYHTFWYGNEKYFRDPYIGLAVAALNSQWMRLGTFIADPYTAHPALTAVSIATLDELCGGRAILLLGAGGGGGTGLGYVRHKPAQALREAIQVIRGLLRGERVALDGEVVRFRQGQLSFPSRADLPIYVASRGNLVLSMAGELADGVMIATYAEPNGVRHALSRVDVGLRKSGRRREDIRVISRVDAWIDDRDPRGARDAVRPMVARLMTTSYPDTRFVEAVGASIPPALLEVMAQKDRELATRSGHLVTDELLDAFTWAGTADQVVARARSVVALGIEDITVCLHPPEGQDIEPAIRRFAEAMRG